MPNWCTNELTITGDPKQIAKFKKRAKAKDTALSLNKFLPLPKDQADNWYDWHINNWGTKWDIDATLEDEWEEGLSYSFDSAWSPPVQWLEKVSKDYPELEFRLKYEEGGVGFMGLAKASAGEVDDQFIEY